jgi:hypothetical protein
MGLYINHTSNGTLPAKGKCLELIKAGAQLLPAAPKVWEEGLVCVADNGYFEAAAYAHNQSKLEHFSDTTHDHRDRVWLKWDKAKEFANA